MGDYPRKVSAPLLLCAGRPVTTRDAMQRVDFATSITRLLRLRDYVRPASVCSYLTWTCIMDRAYKKFFITEQTCTTSASTVIRLIFTPS